MNVLLTVLLNLISVHEITTVRFRGNTVEQATVRSRGITAAVGPSTAGIRAVTAVFLSSQLSCSSLYSPVYCRRQCNVAQFDPANNFTPCGPHATDSSSHNLPLKAGT